MTTERIKRDEAMYVFAYYGDLMTEHERLAYRHLAGTAKSNHGLSDVDAQGEAKRRAHHTLRELLSDDPSVLLLARDGFETFVLRTGQRILNEHRDQIVFNRCPRCSAVARTPRVRQCRVCRHDWHDDAGSQSS